MLKRMTMIAVLALAGAVWAHSACAGITLTYSNFFPPTHIQSKLPEAWCQEIEKRTDGRVSIQYFPGQTLTKSSQAYDAVVNGIADIGLSLFSYTRGRFPVMEAVDLPLGYPNAQVTSAVLNEVYREMKPKELEDVKVMYLHAAGPGLVHCKVRPIRTLEDMKGLKFRATGFSAKLVQALGGTPVAMPMPETYQALSKGVVDGATFPFEAMKGFRLAEVTKYSTESYPVAYATTFFVVMNKKRWQSLPDDVKKIIEEVNAEFAEKTASAWDDIDVGGIAALKQNGGEVVPLAPEEAARWKAAVAPLIDEYIEDANKKGLDGQKIIDVTKKALVKYSEMYAKQ